MFIYRIDNHVVMFLSRLRKYTRRPVWSPDAARALAWNAACGVKACGKACGDTGKFGEFFVVRAEDRHGRHSYFTGGMAARRRGGALRPVFSRDVRRAEFYLDREAAEETLWQVIPRDAGRAEAVAVHLDLMNTLPSQRFVIACENPSGRLAYLKDWDSVARRVHTCARAAGCRRMAFRECLRMIETLRAAAKGYKYSMLHYEPGVDAGSLRDWVARHGQGGYIALSFSLPGDTDHERRGKGRA